MIQVRVTPEQFCAFVRRVAPKLTIDQRLKLIRELTRSDAPAAPASVARPLLAAEPPPPPPLPEPLPPVAPPSDPVTRVYGSPPPPTSAVAALYGDVTTQEPADEETRPGRGWERKLYRLFKPARAVAKQMDPAALSALIRNAVREARTR